MQKINIDKYIETWYFQLKKDGEPINIIPFNWAFATNKYYYSDIPVMQLGTVDLGYNTGRRSDKDYEFVFKQQISEKDRYIINDRDIFFSLMRAYLPKFTLVIENGIKIEINEFVTIYKDGYCSITYLYNLNGLEFDDSLSNNLLYWGKMKYIEIDNNTFKLLGIENRTVKVNYEIVQVDNITYFRIPVEDLLSNLSLRKSRKFAIGFDIIITILSEFFEKESDDLVSSKHVFEYNEIMPTYRYYQFRCNDKIDKNDVNYLRNILQMNSKNYVFNKNIDDMGLDLTQYDKSKTYGYGNMFVHISEKDFTLDLDVIVSYFILFDYFLIEKAKNYSALVKFREIEDSEEINMKDLMDTRSKIIKTLKTDLLYDFSEDNFIKAKAVSKCLHIDRYYKEFEKMYQRINDTIIKTQEMQNEKKEKRVNFIFQLFALIFAIPAIFSIVDIFYAVDLLPKLIIFPISYAKIFWSIIVSLLCWFIISRKL